MARLVILTLLILSACGGFFAGLLGVGGAVVLIPLLLSVPPLAGVGKLSMNQVAGITMIQVLASSIAGFLGHRRGGMAHTRTILTIGIPMGFCALAAAVLSKSMESRTMLIIFGGVVVVAFVMLLKRTQGEGEDSSREFQFNAPLSAFVGSLVGVVSGIVGAGGGFVVIPLMVRLLKIPMRVAVGSSMGIVFIGALMGSLGKIVTLQVEWPYLLPVVAGSVPAALVGARVSRQLPATVVRYVLLAVIGLVLVKTWYSILFPA